MNYEKHFIAEASKVVNEKGKDDEMYNYYSLVKILGWLNTPASNKALSQFSKYSDRKMKFITITACLKNNIPVDSRDIYTLTTTDEYRYPLYEELRKLKKQSLFPLDFLSQEKLARSKLYVDNWDEEYPFAISNVGSRIISYKGKSYKVYLYRVFEENYDDYSSVEEGRTYYLAVSGPFSTNPKEYYSTHELTGIYWDEEYDEKKIDELLKNYIKGLEKKK